MQIELSNISALHIENFPSNFFIFAAFHGLQWISHRTLFHISQIFDFYWFSFHSIFQYSFYLVETQSLINFHLVQLLYFILCIMYGALCTQRFSFSADVITFAPFARMQSENESSRKREPFNQLPPNRISSYHCFYRLLFDMCE